MHDDTPSSGASAPPIIDVDTLNLADRVAKARARLPYQYDPALTKVLSDAELRAERELEEWIREQERQRRRRQLEALLESEDKAREARLAAEDKAREAQAKIQQADIDDLLTARTALAAQRRESSPHSKLARLHRERTWLGRTAVAILVVGMLWSAVNVQHNVAPGASATDALYWFSYLIEAMISACLIMLMIATPRAIEWKAGVNRLGIGGIVTAEVLLLSLTIALNTFPYLRNGQKWEVFTHGIAPMMIAVSMLIHHVVSAIYGGAIAKAAAEIPAEESPLQQPVVHHRAERLDVRDAERFGALDAGAESAVLAGTRSGAGHPALDPALARTAPRSPESEHTDSVADADADPAAVPATAGSTADPALDPAVHPAPALTSENADESATAAAMAAATEEPALRGGTAGPQSTAGSPGADPAPTQPMPVLVRRRGTAGQPSEHAPRQPNKEFAELQAARRNPNLDGLGDGGTGSEGAFSTSATALQQDWISPLYDLAAEIQGRGVASTKSIELVVQVIALTDEGRSINRIADKTVTGLSHHTVKAIRDELASIRHEQIEAGGGRVINLRK